MDEASPFYAAPLPALGFVHEHRGETWKVLASDGEPPSAPVIAITEERSHVPNTTRIAFWAEGRDELDSVDRTLRERLCDQCRYRIGSPRHGYAGLLQRPCLAGRCARRT